MWAKRRLGVTFELEWPLLRNLSISCTIKKRPELDIAKFSGTDILNDTESLAWRSFVILWRLGLSQFDRTFRRHGLVRLEHGIMAVLIEEKEGTMSPSDLADLTGYLQVG